MVGELGREWSRVWVWHGETRPGALMERVGVRGTHWQARSVPVAPAVGEDGGWRASSTATATDPAWEVAAGVWFRREPSEPK